MRFNFPVRLDFSTVKWGNTILPPAFGGRAKADFPTGPLGPSEWSHISTCSRSTQCHPRMAPRGQPCSHPARGADEPALCQALQRGGWREWHSASALSKPSPSWAPLLLKLPFPGAPWSPSFSFKSAKKFPDSDSIPQATKGQLPFSRDCKCAL